MSAANIAIIIIIELCKRGLEYYTIKRVTLAMLIQVSVGRSDLS